MRLGSLLILLVFVVCVASIAGVTVNPAPVYRVASGSMAPAVPGPHYQMTCEHCQFPSIFAATKLPESVTCPNCGKQNNKIASADLHRGDRLIWEPISLEQLRRYDIVLLHDPNDEANWQVKRVAFLPGERPTISGGELWQADQVLRKSPRQREALKQLVFDQAFDLADEPRFRSQRISGSGWHVRRGYLGFAPVGHEMADDGDWLVYHHQRCLPPPSPADKDASPLDSYGYNQDVSRELLPVGDLWLEWRFTHWQAHSVTLRLRGTDQFAEIIIDVEHQIVCSKSGDSVVELPLDLKSLEGKTLRAGVSDSRAFVEIEDDHQHLSYPLGAIGIQPGSQPLAMRIAGGPAVIRQAKAFRDIVFQGANRQLATWSFDRDLKPGEIFVLGDNVPVSQDSRFSLGVVDARKSLRGRVLRVLAD
ncbi:hypothetical protein GC197_11260 [bacterium]|nr:hypothetical protein [bacterium]